MMLDELRSQLEANLRDGPNPQWVGVDRRAVQECLRVIDECEKLRREIARIGRLARRIVVEENARGESAPAKIGIIEEIARTILAELDAERIE